MSGGKWEPNENHLRALDYARENQYVFQVKKLSALLGISRQAIYDWNRCEDFNDWWNGYRDEFFAARLDQVHGMVYARAAGISRSGSTQDAKLFLERFDKAYAPRQRSEVTGADGAPLKTYICVDPAEVTGIPAEGEEKGDEG